MNHLVPEARCVMMSFEPSPHIVDVEKQQVALEEVDGQPGNCSRFGVTVELVETIAPGNAAQHRVAGPHAFHEEVEQCCAYCDDDAIQDAKHEDAHNADHGECELDPADPPHVAQGACIDEADGGRSKNSSERRRGQVGQRIGEERVS